MEATRNSVYIDTWRFITSECDITEYKFMKNVLIVDDNDDIRELLSVILHEEGRVYTAANGLDALSKFACHHFDVIVSDIEMPVMNGIEFYENVPPIYKTSFLFFSGTVNEEYIRYLSMHNLRLFMKPAEIMKLHDAVHLKLQGPFYEGLTA